MTGKPEIPESASAITNLILNTSLIARPMSEGELMDFYTLNFSGVDLLVMQKALLEAMEQAGDNIDKYFHSGITLMTLLFRISDLKPDLIKGQEFEKLIATVSVGLLAKHKGAIEQNHPWEIEMTKTAIESVLDSIQSCSSISEESKIKLITIIESELT